MPKAIGLTYPMAALFLYGLLYNPWWAPKLPPPQFFFLASALFILRTKKIPLSDLGIERKNLHRRIAIGLGLGFIPVVITLVLAGFLTLLKDFTPSLHHPLFGGPPLPVRITSTELISLLILAPICEELFFRGIFLRALVENYSTWIAILASSVIFMLGHGGWLVPGPLILGVVAAFATLQTRSIVPGMVFHAISNLYAPLMIWFFPNLYRQLDFLYR